VKRTLAYYSDVAGDAKVGSRCVEHQEISMNKRTIAIAAVALLTTTGLASARTVHTTQAVAADPARASQPMDPSEAAYATNPFQAPYGRIGGLDNVTSYNNPGDNDMDPILNH
jgi:hypothetical protein